jgi:hypothetical protein
MSKVAVAFSKEIDEREEPAEAQHRAAMAETLALAKRRAKRDLGISLVLALALTVISCAFGQPAWAGLGWFLLLGAAVDAVRQCDQQADRRSSTRSWDENSASLRYESRLPPTGMTATPANRSLSSSGPPRPLKGRPCTLLAKSPEALLSPL